MSFNHPLYVLFSSGTTGLPKCITHGHGGSLLQHLKELALHTNVKSEDKMLFLTTCGWMMWNWTVSNLLLGSSIVLYDGSPFYPNINRVINITKDTNSTMLGAGAKVYETMSVPPLTECIKDFEFKLLLINLKVSELRGEPVDIKQLIFFKISFLLDL